MIAHTAPSPAPMLDSPSEMTGRATCPVTRALTGSIRETPPGCFRTHGSATKRRMISNKSIPSTPGVPHP
jgi:hypothetical protein